MGEPTIRAMTPADVTPAAEMIRQGEWGDRSVFLAWAVGYEPSHAFVADDGGRIVGTGIATVHGRVGWVGTIFVASDRRREGLGGTLTATVIDDLVNRGCETLLLIASDQGRPLYERLGFEVQAAQHRFTAVGLPAALPDGRVRAFEPGMLADVATFYRRATGEDRPSLLATLASPGTARVVLRPDGSLGGFMIRPPWGGHSLVAPDPDDAMTLLDARRREVGPDGHVSAAMPGPADGRQDRLLAAGWVPGGAGTRMIRGAPLDWRPDWIWGNLSGAIG